MTAEPEKWIRYRFHANAADYRPVQFPPPGPYWCNGFGEGYAIIVAYLPFSAVLTDFWPEASHIDLQKVDANCPTLIAFSDRFPCPDWYQPS
jgi:hypothetical protein